MEWNKREYYVGEDALSKIDIMNYQCPVVNGEIVDWDKFETLLIIFEDLKLIPEESSLLFSECPINPSKVVKTC